MADDGIEITVSFKTSYFIHPTLLKTRPHSQADKIVALTSAASVELEPIWATLLAKALEGKNVKELLSNVGAGGAGPAVGAAPAGGAAAAAGGAAAAEEKEEEKKEEEKEESDDDMVRLFRVHTPHDALGCLCAFFYPFLFPRVSVYSTKVSLSHLSIRISFALYIIWSAPHIPHAALYYRH